MHLWQYDDDKENWGWHLKTPGKYKFAKAITVNLQQSKVDYQPSEIGVEYVTCLFIKL